MDLIELFPQFTFYPGQRFSWQPSRSTITFDPKRIETEKGKFLLLHEIGHAMLDHKSPLDYGRYTIEREAWDMARSLAQQYGIKMFELDVKASLNELRSLGY